MRMKRSSVEPVEPATEVEAELQTELAEEEYDADLVEEEEEEAFDTTKLMHHFIPTSMQTM